MPSVFTASPPRVSVVLPVFNGERNLGACLEALTGQSYPAHCLEIIVIDDGSTDSTAEICRRFGVRLLRSRRTRGAYASRNRGIRASTGHIIAFTDSDCLPDSNWLRAGTEEMLERGSEIVAGRVDFTFQGRIPLGAEAWDAVAFLQQEHSVFFRGAAACANLMVSRSVFTRHGLFGGGLRSGGDLLFTARAVAAGARIAYAPQATVRHPSRPWPSLLAKSFRVGIGKGEIARRNLDAQRRLPLAACPQLVFLRPAPLNAKLDRIRIPRGRGLRSRAYGVGLLAIACAGMGYLWGRLPKAGWHRHLERIK